MGAHAAGNLSEDELTDLELHACPGPGSCGGMYTANTMSSALEAMGLSVPGSASPPAMDERRDQVCVDAGHLVMDCVRNNRRPSDIITKESIENAVTVALAAGGSTNAALHLPAIAWGSGHSVRSRRYRPRQQARAPYRRHASRRQIRDG